MVAGACRSTEPSAGTQEPHRPRAHGGREDLRAVGVRHAEDPRHEEAAHQWFGTNIEIVPELLFKNLVERVATGQSEYAMMAIENTLSGTIHGNLRLIAENEVEKQPAGGRSLSDV